MHLFISLLIWTIFGVCTAYIAKQKRRDPQLWFVIGAFLGFIGLIIIFMMPDLTEESDDTQNNRTSSRPLLLKPQNPLLPDLYLYKQWFYLDEDHAAKGPFTFDELREKWREGIIKNNDLVWCEEMIKWNSIEDLKLFKTEI